MSRHSHAATSRAWPGSRKEGRARGSKAKNIGHHPSHLACRTPAVDSNALICKTSHLRLDQWLSVDFHFTTTPRAFANFKLRHGVHVAGLQFYMQQVMCILPAPQKTSWMQFLVSSKGSSQALQHKLMSHMESSLWIANLDNEGRLYMLHHHMCLAISPINKLLDAFQLQLWSLVFFYWFGFTCWGLKRTQLSPPTKTSLV